MRKIAVFLIRIYQYAVSPIFPPCCRYTPSCSHYAAQAVARHGCVRGGSIALKRLLRCHPWGRCGYDPVPDGKPCKPGHMSHNSVT